MEDLRARAVAGLFAAGFLAFGFSATERDFFRGAETRFPLPAAEVDSAMSVPFLSVFALGCFGTF